MNDHLGIAGVQQLCVHVNAPIIEPLFRIGAMVGLGRKEFIYLNDHLEELKPVPGIRRKHTGQHAGPKV